MTHMSITTIFTPDYARYEGVRPINIYALRLFYLLMFLFIATDSWRTILTHQGPWDHVRAVAFCVWATYTTMSALGVIHPLKFLPIMIFMIGYKVLWLIVVAYPLWRAGTLAGSPAEEMAKVFMWISLPIIAVPWKYVFQNYVMGSKKRSPEPSFGALD
jgi:hypothetical protein